MTTPLWTDGRIKGALIGNLLIDSEVTPVLDEGAALNMRDEYEAEIARLKAQLAATWQPVADGDFDCDCSDSECRNKYTVEADGIFLTISEGDDFLTVDLGSRRLCKQVTP